MDTQFVDDDADAAAMAEAMGFSGFGSQRPAKRKFNANADAAVSSSGEKRGGNVSKTGANNAPLGIRKSLPLPPPSDSLPARLGGVVAGTGNAEEIDLDEDKDPAGGYDLDATKLDVKNKFIDVLRTPGGYQSEDAGSMVAQPPAHTVVDNGPPGLPSRPSHQQSFQHGPILKRGKGGRDGGRDFRPPGEAGAPWWEGYYDAKMNENPWDRLERDRGLQPRGKWVARNGGLGFATNKEPLAATAARDTEAVTGDKQVAEDAPVNGMTVAAAASSAEEP